jgi:hypothetical protein
MSLTKFIAPLWESTMSPLPQITCLCPLANLTIVGSILV